MARESRPKGRRSFTSRIFRFTLLLAFGALALAGYITWVEKQKAGSALQAAPALPPPAVPVQTTVVQPKSIEITRLGLGTVTPWQMVNIAAQVSGRIVQIPFREGHEVKEAETLLRIDPRPFQAALDQAKAKKDQDVANLANTQKNLQRDQTLIAKGGFATQQTVDNETAQVQMLKAAIEGDEAAIESAQVNLEFATVKSPFAGIVSLRTVDTGNLVNSSTSIGTVTQIEPIAVNFTLPQADLSDIQAAAKSGSPTVLAYEQSGNKLLSKGSLEVINNQVDQASGTIKLKARFENKDHKLWPGAFVQASVVIRTEQNALAVPSEAVQRGPDNAYVWLVGSDQTVHRQPVQIGEIQNGVTVISKGVAPGQRIVVTGQYSLIQGARITEANPSQVMQTQG